MPAKEWPLSKQWYVDHDCDRCKRAASNGVFYEPDEVRHRREGHAQIGMFTFNAKATNSIPAAMDRARKELEARRKRAMIDGNAIANEVKAHPELRNKCWGIKILSDGSHEFFYHPWGCEGEFSASDLQSLVKNMVGNEE